MVYREKDALWDISDHLRLYVRAKTFMPFATQKRRSASEFYIVYCIKDQHVDGIRLTSESNDELPRDFKLPCATNNDANLN